MIGLLDDLIYLTNNFVCHFVDQESLEDKSERLSLVTLQGLDHVYIQLMQSYTDIERDLGEQILSPNIWATLTWGMATFASYIQGKSQVYDNKLRLQQDQPVEVRDEIEKQYQDYFFPYETFIANYMERAYRIVEQNLQVSIKGMDMRMLEEAQKQMDAIEGDLISCLGSLCPKLPSYKVIKSTFCRNLAIKILKKRDQK